MLLSFCEENPSMTSGFPPQRDCNAENVSVWWRRSVVLYFQSHIPCTVLVDIVDGQSDLQRQQQQLVDRISEMHTLLDNFMESHGTLRVQFSQSDSFSRNQSSSIVATKTSTPRRPRVAVQLPPIDDDIPMPHDAAMVNDSVSNEQASTSPRQQIVDLDKSTHDSSTDLDRGTDFTTNIARQENVGRIDDGNMTSSLQQILADPSLGHPLIGTCSHGYILPIGGILLRPRSPQGVKPHRTWRKGSAKSHGVGAHIGGHSSSLWPKDLHTKWLPQTLEALSRCYRKQVSQPPLWQILIKHV